MANEGHMIEAWIGLASLAACAVGIGVGPIAFMMKRPGIAYAAVGLAVVGLASFVVTVGVIVG